MPRNVTPHADMQRKLGITTRSLDQFAKAIVRNAGAGILGNGMDYAGLAAFDKYFGDYFADRSTVRDCLKVILTLGTCVGDKVGFAESHGLAENRTRHSDSIIGGKCPDQ